MPQKKYAILVTNLYSRDVQPYGNMQAVLNHNKEIGVHKLRRKLAAREPYTDKKVRVVKTEIIYE